MSGVRLTAYSCGGSHGIGLSASPCSLLIPEGNHRREAYESGSRATPHIFVIELAIEESPLSQPVERAPVS